MYMYALCGHGTLVAAWNFLNLLVLTAVSDHNTYIVQYPVGVHVFY